MPQVKPEIAIVATAHPNPPIRIFVRANGDAKRMPYRLECSLDGREVHGFDQLWECLIRLDLMVWDQGAYPVDGYCVAYVCDGEHAATMTTADDWLDGMHVAINHARRWIGGTCGSHHLRH